MTRSVLFSNGAIRRFINENFVAAWENVRNVPLVTIDFGDGRTLKRTVLGNVATYICMPDGRVLDIIPGVNTPESYLDALVRARNLYLAAALGADVRKYHRTNGTIPPTVRPVPAAPASRIADFGKTVRIERPILKLVREEEVAAPDRTKVDRIERPILFPPAAGTPERDSLEKDTAYNRKERKPLVHRILAERAWKPGEITGRVYREVLHCDLDDPYLGLDTIDFKGGGYASAPPVRGSDAVNR